MAALERETGIVSQDISLKEKVAFLKQKDHYPDSTGKVKAVKTHMSWVFLTDRYVYKLKIPFRYDHLKLLTREARHKNCLEEVRLNKRLAKDIYLGVIPLSLNRDGDIVFGEGEEYVDWLVKMKRLPEKNMLEHRIKSGKKISTDQLKPAVELLTNFYLNAGPVQLSPQKHHQMMKTTLDKIRDELLSPDFDLDAEGIERAYQNQVHFIDEHTNLFKQRIEEGRIVEGHGDLKPDHICLDPPVVIDCLEFSKKLRTLDVLDDLGFLGLECDRLGAHWIGEYFIKHYAKQTGDMYATELIHFYKSYQAMVRVLLSVRHLREKEYQGDPKWEKRAKKYLNLANKYLDRIL
jgi:aminoglycoside phosphotransferase family enzyme